ncbi:MAG: hypothetical protein ABR887_05765 [Methanoregulaceae archaeon]|jgi:two-component SAPR family response regulator
MTNVRDMIKQVEIVFYDHEYPLTKKELEGMLKILKTIYIHNKLNRAMHHTPTAIASKKSGVFRNTISSYICTTLKNVNRYSVRHSFVTHELFAVQSTS